MTRRQLCL